MSTLGLNRSGCCSLTGSCHPRGPPDPAPISTTGVLWEFPPCHRSWPSHLCVSLAFRDWFHAQKANGLAYRTPMPWLRFCCCCRQGLEGRTPDPTLTMLGEKIFQKKGKHNLKFYQDDWLWGALCLCDGLERPWDPLAHQNLFQVVGGNVQQLLSITMAEWLSILKKNANCYNVNQRRKAKLNIN